MSILSTTFISMLLGAAIVLLLLPKILMLSLRKRLIDEINSRKVHKSTASRLGGVAFFPAIFISFTLAIAIYGVFGGAALVPSESLYLEFAALLMLYLVGVYDDLINIPYRIKFAVQIATSVIVLLRGTHIMFIYGIDYIISLPWFVSYPLTALFIVFVTNSINLIDGINGLASMLSILALLTYGALFFIVADNINGIVAFTTAGVLIPFWHHNVFGVRKRISARIFMGDGGALVIGFILSVMSIKLWNINLDSRRYSDMFHVLSYTMLFIPCIDVVRVMLDRYLSKRPIFLPDKNHIHHRFMALGYSPRRTLFTIILMQIGIVILNITLSSWLNIVYIFIINVSLWSVVHFIMNRRIEKVKIEYANE